MIGPEGNSEFCFQRISMFPETCNLRYVTCCTSSSLNRTDATKLFNLPCTERIIRPDEFGKTFVARFVMHLKFNDGYKTYYASRTILRNASWTTHSERKTRLDALFLFVPVFILKTHNQTNLKCLPKFFQTVNASLVWRRPIVERLVIKVSDKK